MPVPMVDTLIKGSWVHSEEWLEVGNPADLENPVACVPALTEADVVLAFDAAEEGFAIWRKTSPFERAVILREAGRLLRDRVDEIAMSVVSENGKTLAEATGEVIKSAEFLEYYAGLDREAYGSILHDARPNTKASFHREPVGVVLAITPWNDPLLTPARKLAPALMCGNSVVLKPASETPLSSLHLARALQDAGLPSGVLNVVTGRSSTIAEALATDERTAAVTFTGSNPVGEKLRIQFAQRNIRFQAEMGGKNASAVLSDADLSLAADKVVAAAFGGSGQRCTATSRLIIDQSVAAEFFSLLIERVSRLVVGSGCQQGTTVGPMVSWSHQETVLGFMERAIEEGATVLAGGPELEGDVLTSGHFVRPTVLVGVTPEMEIWQEEVFGPVLVVREVDGISEAINAVNDSTFGLAAAVFTDGLSAAQQFVDEVDAGQIAVNTTTSGWDIHMPFGGFRGSGSPFKEQGSEAVGFYTRVKVVAVHTPPQTESAGAR